MIKEMFKYNRFVYTPTKPSQLSPGEFVEDEDNATYTCPACGHVQKPLEHGKARPCVCGVVATVHGNSLVLTKEES